MLGLDKSGVERVLSWLDHVPASVTRVHLEPCLLTCIPQPHTPDSSCDQGCRACGTMAEAAASAEPKRVETDARPGVNADLLALNINPKHKSKNLTLTLTLTPLRLSGRAQGQRGDQRPRSHRRALGARQGARGMARRMHCCILSLHSAPWQPRGVSLCWPENRKSCKLKDFKCQTQARDAPKPALAPAEDATLQIPANLTPNPSPDSK